MISTLKKETLGFNGAQSSRGSARGFATTVFLLFLPLALVLVSWLSIQSARINEIQEIERTCHVHLIKGQERASQKISALLKLNSLAQTLRSELISAKAALALAIASANAAAITSARIWIKKVQGQRDSLILTQKSLIFSGQSDLYQSSFKAQSSIRQWARDSQSQASILAVNVQALTVSKTKLAIRKSNAPDPFPEYELSQPFSKKQTLVLRWQGHFRSTAKGFKRWVPNFKKEIQCGVSLREKEQGFQAFPITGRFF